MSQPRPALATPASIGNVRFHLLALTERRRRSRRSSSLPPPPHGAPPSPSRSRSFPARAPPLPRTRPTAPPRCPSRSRHRPRPPSLPPLPLSVSRCPPPSSRSSRSSACTHARASAASRSASRGLFQQQHPRVQTETPKQLSFCLRARAPPTWSSMAPLGRRGDGQGARTLGGGGRRKHSCGRALPFSPPPLVKKRRGRGRVAGRRPSASRLSSSCT